MKRTWYDVSRVGIDVVPWDTQTKTEDIQKKFFEFVKVFEVYLEKYASSTMSVATSQFDVCGYDSQGILYGNNINFDRPIALSTINKILKNIDSDGQFAIKKIEYCCESNVSTVFIEKLD